MKVRSVLPEAKFGADVDVVEYCLSKGSSLPPDVQLSILECILGVDEIQSKPTEWDQVIDFILELDTAKLEIEKLCSICHGNVNSFRELVVKPHFLLKKSETYSPL